MGEFSYRYLFKNDDATVSAFFQKLRRNFGFLLAEWTLKIVEPGGNGNSIMKATVPH